MNRKLYGRLIFELSHPGRRGVKIPSNGIDCPVEIPEGLRRTAPVSLPEVDEPTVRATTTISAPTTSALTLASIP